MVNDVQHVDSVFNDARYIRGTEERLKADKWKLMENKLPKDLHKTTQLASVYNMYRLVVLACCICIQSSGEMKAQKLLGKWSNLVSFSTI